MAEYIERDKLSDVFELCNKQNPRWTPQRVKSLIVRATAADVAPVRHGEWLICCDGYYPYCSKCGEEPYRANNRNLPKFCPNCGARMDGE